LEDLVAGENQEVDFRGGTGGGGRGFDLERREGGREKGV